MQVLDSSKENKGSPLVKDWLGGQISSLFNQSLYNNMFAATEAICCSWNELRIKGNKIKSVTAWSVSR